MYTRRTAALAASLFLSVLPMLAHHSFAAEFDQTKSITLAGVVTKLEWTNPHVHFYVDVKEDGGKVTHWDFEGGSPNGLGRQGWTRNSLKVGDTVTVQGFRAKDGSNLASAGMVKLPDGRQVFEGAGDAGSAGEKPNQ
jgi:hypothetical protein